MNKYWRTRNNFSFITETHFLRNLYFYTDLLISSYSFAISSIVYQYSYSFILHLFTSILFGYSLHIGIIFFPNLPIKLKTKLLSYALGINSSTVFYYDFKKQKQRKQKTPNFCSIFISSPIICLKLICIASNF